MPRNITGAPVTGEDLYGRAYDINAIWQKIEADGNVLLLAPRRVGKTSIMLELLRVPRAGWRVFYSDLEGGDSPAELLAVLASEPDLRSWLETIPFRDDCLAVLKRLAGTVTFELLRVELKTAIGGNWIDDARRLETRLESLPAKVGKLLFILDELPILLSHILKKEDGITEAEALLTWFRRIRLNPKLRRIRFLAAGSVGLEGLLRKHHLSAHVNDFTPVRIEAWPPDVAEQFLLEVGKSTGFTIPSAIARKMINLLSDAVPYHVQLFFDAAKDMCRGDQTMLSMSLAEKTFLERLAGPSGTAHLDHYAGRLELLMTADELQLARLILQMTARSKKGAEISRLSQLAPGNGSLFNRVFRQLREDSYIRVEGGRALFASNLVRTWWRANEAAEWSC